MSAHYVVGLSYWAFWMLFGWGTFGVVMLVRRLRKGTPDGK